MFQKIVAAPADPILGLTDTFKADIRAEKINLGVGIYKNEAGQTPILKAVKQAEAALLDEETTKSYLSIEGTPEYARAVQTLLFGQNALVMEEKRSKTAQAPGGTGALRLAGEFIRRQLGDVNIWISQPTWANHIGVFQAANLNIKYYRYYDAEKRTLDFDGLLTDLEQAKAGDIVLLHGCCHNPTGIDPTQEQWETLVNVCQQKGLLPLFDFAYQGFAAGVEQDAQGLRTFVKTGMEVLIASSFSKNFGLYNERVGAFTLVARNAQEAETAFSQVKSIARVIYSNPPAHGSAIVSHILQNTKRRQAWENEVTEMRNRIKEMRTLFVKTLQECGVKEDFQFIEEQNGMFSFSGLTPDQVNQLKESFAIYIVGSGRISVAGMTKENMLPLCKGIADVLAK